MNRSATLMGMQLYITPDIPKMQLSADCPVSPDVRAETNAWMIKFFGVTNTLLDGQTIADGQGRIFVNPRTYRQLQQIK